MALRFSPPGGASALALRSLVRGPTGITGTAATITAGTTTTGAEGSSAAISNSGSSSAAIFDFTIPRGAAPAVGYTFSTTTTDSDPGNGIVRFNNATPASITAIYFDNQDADGNTVTTWLDTFDDSSNTSHKGFLTFTDVASPSTKIGFDVTGSSVTDGTGYRKVTVTHSFGTTLFTDAHRLAVTFARTGNKGTDGAGTGDVSAAAANTADNRVVRTDGSSGKGIQESVINLDDTTGTLYPQTNDSGALGKSAQSWADLFLASGGVINFNAGDVTVTHSSNALAFAGASSGYSFDAATLPSANDSAALGAAATSWADLFLASGAVVNYANGNFTITHSSGALTMSGTLSLGTSNAFTCGSIELGHATANTLTGSSGDALIEGVILKKVGKETVWIPAGAMTARTTNGAAAGEAEMSSNKNMFKTLDFDTTTQEFAQFEIFMPKSWNLGTVTFQPVWSHASTTTNFGVVWALQAIARSDDDAGDVAFGTEQTSTDTGGTTNDIYIGPESSAITVGGSPAAGDTVQFQIKRNPSDGSDTMAIDARLHGVKLFFTTSASTDA